MTSHFHSFQFLLLLTLLCTTATTTVAQATNITKILEKAGQFTTLINLFAVTKVVDQINNQLISNSKQGMTIFAPTDNAFSSLTSGTLNSLSDEQKDELAQFHVIPTFISASELQTVSNPLRTTAGDSASYKFPLYITTSGNQVNLTTGVVNTTVSNTIYADEGTLAVYQVEKVLLPMSLFGPQPPATAQAPETETDNKKKSGDVSTEPDGTAGVNSSGGVNLRGDLHGLMEGAIAFTAMFYLWKEYGFDCA